LFFLLREVFDLLKFLATQKGHIEVYEFCSDMYCHSISLIAFMLEAVDFVRVVLNIYKRNHVLRSMLKSSLCSN